MSVHPFNGFNGISCPSVTLGVGVGAPGVVGTSTDPKGGWSAWALETVEPIADIDAVSRASTTLCLAIDNRSNVLVGS